MELWNDFEGKTVDGRFQLEHLIGPKGRSAYFTTKDETGAAAVIRLIESLNDEEEILGRWRTVTGLKQEHLLGLLACGKTVLDGTHLVYAVMEPTDMELAEVLRERALTTDETRQIALSVADGLETLHAKGLVHEHVEADNVLAQGETVKLRSDVVREAPEGAEGASMRARDVHDLSVLLVQCLTRSRTLNGTRLPTPFDELVRKGESGAWGLGEIVAALRPMGAPATTRPVVPVTPVVPPATAAGARGVAGGGVARTEVLPGGGVRPGAAPAATGGVVPEVAGAAAASSPAAVASRLANQSDGLGGHLRSPRDPDRIVLETEDERKRPGLLIAIGAGVVLLVLLGILFFRSSRKETSQSVVQHAPAAATSPEQSAEARPLEHEPETPMPHRVAEKPSAAVGDTTSRGVRVAGSGRVVTEESAPAGAGDWRVVAFTYNREDQAAEKARAIGVKHGGLHPEVFSPNGRAPYLVTLGGWMSSAQAASLRAKARGEGIARDVYAQNYTGKGR